MYRRTFDDNEVFPKGSIQYPSSVEACSTRDRDGRALKYDTKNVYLNDAEFFIFCEWETRTQSKVTKYIGIVWIVVWNGMLSPTTKQNQMTLLS